MVRCTALLPESINCAESESAHILTQVNKSRAVSAHHDPTAVRQLFVFSRGASPKIPPTTLHLCPISPITSLCSRTARPMTQSRNNQVTGRTHSRKPPPCLQKRSQAPASAAGYHQRSARKGRPEHTLPATSLLLLHRRCLFPTSV